MAAGYYRRMSQPAESPAELRLTRVGEEARRDRARKYKVLLDGREVGAIGAGECLSLPVTAGEHELRLKIDWLGSPSVHFTAIVGATCAFACGPNGTSGSTMLDIVRGTFGMKPLITLSRAD